MATLNKKLQTLQKILKEKTVFMNLKQVDIKAKVK